MKRLFGLLKDRDAGGESHAPAEETREAWSPTGDGGTATLARSAAPETGVRPIAPEPEAPAKAEPTDLISIEGHPLQDSMLAALKSVYDPEIPVDIYELGLIYDVKLNAENDVFVKMTLTAPGCPVAGQMPGMVRAAIEENVPEARAVDVEIVWDPPWRPDMMSEAARLETGML